MENFLFSIPLAIALIYSFRITCKSMPTPRKRAMLVVRWIIPVLLIFMATSIIENTLNAAIGYKQRIADIIFYILACFSLYILFESLRFRLGNRVSERNFLNRKYSIFEVFNDNKSTADALLNENYQPPKTLVALGNIALVVILFFLLAIFTFLIGVNVYLKTSKKHFEDLNERIEHIQKQIQKNRQNRNSGEKGSAMNGVKIRSVWE